MKPKISIVSLTVSDFDRALTFRPAAKVVCPRPTANDAEAA